MAYSFSAWRSSNFLRNYDVKNQGYKKRSAVPSPEIIRSYDKYKEKKFAPVYVKEALTKAYCAYHALGGNDVATALYNETMELPTEPSFES